MLLTKRKFLTGLVSSLVAAPAICRAGNLMPIYNGLIVKGRGSYSITGLTVDGKTVMEFLEPGEWTLTRFIKLLDADGKFDDGADILAAVNFCNAGINDRRQIEGIAGNLNWRGWPCKVSPFAGRDMRNFPVADRL